METAYTVAADASITPNKTTMESRKDPQPLLPELTLAAPKTVIRLVDINPNCTRVKTSFMAAGRIAIPTKTPKLLR
jgi:hypothetical protein